MDFLHWKMADSPLSSQTVTKDLAPFEVMTGFKDMLIANSTRQQLLHEKRHRVYA